ncbi:MAG TPA: XRE family transcriptional regulator, partial [Candidatus Solibacter sp.]|nr:XRE family transcriptional regulator [Candidatus Solibacter sp.]
MVNPAPLAKPVTVRIGGIAATVQVAGIAGPGQYQFNVVVPNVPDGDNAVSVEIGGSSSQANAFLAVQRSALRPEGDVAMKREALEVLRGSGNVFRGLGYEDADGAQFKAPLAAEIIKAPDREGLSLRAAHSRTGVAAADCSRIRNADLGRFTVDRLMSIVNRPGSRVEV